MHTLIEWYIDLFENVGDKQKYWTKCRRTFHIENIYRKSKLNNKKRQKSILYFSKYNNICVIYDFEKDL